MTVLMSIATLWNRFRLVESQESPSDVAALLSNPLYMSKLFPQIRQPFKLIPFYHKASKQINNSQVTLCTHVDKLRLTRLTALAQDWQGPMSVLVHLHPDDSESKQQLHQMLQLPSVSQWTDVHLLIDKVERHFNLWRNIARMLARSRFILQNDADFTPSRNIQKQHELLSRLDQENIMIVLPAFEFSKGNSTVNLPTTKLELLAMKDSLQTFHHDWPRAHSPTNYKRWLTATEPYVVKDYNYHYEPYVVMLQIGPPWCDERFLGYGSNKAACFYDAHLNDYEFVVAPNDFVMHVHHEYVIERGIERKVNRRLYEVFRDERCLQANRMRQPSALGSNTLKDELKCIAYGRSTLSEGVILWDVKTEEQLAAMDTNWGGSIL